jgi:hypothetical protein
VDDVQALVAVQWRSCGASGAGFLEPDVEGVGPGVAIGTSCQLMSAGTEVAVNEGVSEKEILGLPRRFESLHLSLSSSRRPMRVLGAIIQISALSVLHAG